MNNLKESNIKMSDDLYVKFDIIGDEWDIPEKSFYSKTFRSIFDQIHEDSIILEDLEAIIFHYGHNH